MCCLQICKIIDFPRLTTIIKLYFRLVGGVVWLILKGLFQLCLKAG